ncbi:MAG: hypothetical protein IPP47_14300 [Bryobacterales bacterium]|nr:hypothetical protein [Bryobacterales bacterium]
MRVEAAPKRVMLAPQNKPLPFRFENGYAVCRLEKVIGHQAVSVEL